MDIKQKHKRLMTVLSKRGLDDQQRHELIYNWTAGRTSSSKELSEKELNDIFWKLNYDHTFLSSADQAVKDNIKKKRSIVLAIATRVGIHDAADWKPFNRFMENKSIYKKALKEYKIDELDDLIRQFRGIESNYNKSALNVGTKAHLHKFKVPPIILN